MKFKYDVNSNKIVMTPNDAQDVRMYIAGYNAIAKRAGMKDELRRTYLGIDLMQYASDLPKNMNPQSFLELLSTASAAIGVKLYDI